MRRISSWNPLGPGRELSEEEAFAQLHRLRWEMEDDAFLLLGRVSDLIRRQELDAAVDKIKLEKAPSRFIKIAAPREFPYFVVIETYIEAHRRTPKIPSFQFSELDREWGSDTSYSLTLLIWEHV